MLETFEQSFSQNKEEKEEKELVKFLPGEVFDHILRLREAISEDIIGINSVYKMPDGTLAGSADIPGKLSPFQGDTLIKEIAGKKMPSAWGVHTQPDGTLAGVVALGDKWDPSRKYVPFKGDILIKEIAGEEVTDAHDLHTQPDGTLTGRVKVSVEPQQGWFPFKGNTLIKEIAGEEVTDAHDLHTQPDGTLAGIVEINGIYLPFQGDTLIKKIAGKKLLGVEDIHTQSDGTLAGVAIVERREGYGFPYNQKHVPFKGDTLIEEIAGKEVMHADYVESYPDGTLTGKIIPTRATEKKQWYPFLWSESREILF